MDALDIKQHRPRPHCRLLTVGNCPPRAISTHHSVDVQFLHNGSLGDAELREIAQAIPFPEIRCLQIHTKVVIASAHRYQSWVYADAPEEGERDACRDDLHCGMHTHGLHEVSRLGNGLRIMIMRIISPQ